MYPGEICYKAEIGDALLPLIFDALTEYVADFVSICSTCDDKYNYRDRLMVRQTAGQKDRLNKKQTDKKWQLSRQTDRQTDSGQSKIDSEKYTQCETEKWSHKYPCTHTHAHTHTHTHTHY